MAKKDKKAKEARPVSEDHVVESDSEEPVAVERLRVAPKGYKATEIKQDDSLAISQDSELVVIRVPLDFPVDALDGIEIPLENLSAAASLTTIEVEKPTKSKSAASSKPITKYALNSLSVPVPGVTAVGGEIGEMDEFVALLPDAKSGGYKISSKKFTRHFSITPVAPKLPTAADFVKSAHEIQNIPYKARVHPDGLKPQYVPFGAETEGKALKESMGRYTPSDPAAVKKEKTGSKRKSDVGMDISPKKGSATKKKRE
ncbi:hypothetical protein HDU80_011797 [Chytriomyces hyalinus]|nr:hypothetical protein HDU80_011797 [Chytriomyces hyalinus]